MDDTILLEYQGKFGRGRTVEDIVSWVETVPPIPEAANRALRLIDDPDSTPGEIAAVLTKDPALITTVLRVANSASFGRSEVVTTGEGAVLVIGLSALKSLLLGFTLKRWNRQFGDLEKLVWEKSLGTSAAAFTLANHFGKRYQETVRLCGLLHNLGQIIMLAHPAVRSDYPKVLEYIATHQVEFEEAEREVIGFSYPLIGAMVARRWELPMTICTTILRHTEPFDGIGNTQDEQIAITKLAVGLSLAAGLGCPAGHPVADEILSPLAMALGCKEPDFAKWRTTLSGQVRELYTAENSNLN